MNTRPEVDEICPEYLNQQLAYYRQAAPKSRLKFVDLIGKDVCDCIEYRAKSEMRDYCLDMIAELRLKYSQSQKKHEFYLTRRMYADCIKGYQKDVTKLERRLRQLVKKERGGITDDDIKRAKEYPLDNLLEINRQGKALCLWHEDTKPSLDCRNGFVHCHVCQVSGDSIDVYMKINGVSFPEAVRSLNEI
jgi:hypothetical protein